MKALSVYPIWAALIREGLKTVEVRTWATRYRGRILICATQRPNPDKLPAGVAICTAEIVDCRPMVPTDEAAAGVACSAGCYAWVLRDVRPLEPFPVRGRQKLFDVTLPARRSAEPPAAA